MYEMIANTQTGKNTTAQTFTGDADHIQEMKAKIRAAAKPGSTITFQVKAL